MFCSTGSVFSHPPHRFQTDFASLSEWLIGASKLLKTWSNLAKTSELNQECIHNHLIKLLVRLFCLLSTFIYHKWRRTIVNNGLLTQEQKSCFLSPLGDESLKGA